MCYFTYLFDVCRWKTFMKLDNMLLELYAVSITVITLLQLFKTNLILSCPVHVTEWKPVDRLPGQFSNVAPAARWLDYTMYSAQE